MTGENSEKDQKKGKTLQRGTLFIIEGAWGYDIEPYAIYSGRGGGGPAGERPEREFEDESVLDGDELIAVSLRMVDTPGILTKDFGNSHK